ncbi:enoyl-CoA hydratase/isomerase family protein [Streptomyces sp. NPDC050743]|uniref:enoyl-CoA hydratase/isomerase family protein n=1 Tax=Streptomyces sp. NPDC050743 TaxID=3365634 RepID=UPI00379B45FA
MNSAAFPDTKGTFMIQIVKQDGTAYLTLDRPPLNYLNPELMISLRDAMLACDSDASVRAIVLRGAGEVFCGGVDGGEVRQGDPAEFARTLVSLLRVFPGLGKPVLGAINGDALMSGFALAVMTDVAVAARGARLGTTEAQAGMWPMIAQVPPLLRLQPRHALENILTGEPFSADRAAQLGIVNEVVEPGELDATVARWVERVTRAAPEVLARGRRAAHRFLQMPFDEALESGLGEFVKLLS